MGLICVKICKCVHCTDVYWISFVIEIFFNFFFFIANLHPSIKHNCLFTLSFHLTSSTLVLGFRLWEKMFLRSVMVGILLERRSCWRSKRKERSEWSVLVLLIYLKRHFMNYWRFHEMSWIIGHIWTGNVGSALMFLSITTHFWVN